MTKAEFIERVAGRTGLSRSKTEDVVNAALDTIGNTLRDGGAVRFQGFGEFRAVERGARTGRNVVTGEAMEIPARTVVKFKPSKSLLGVPA